MIRILPACAERSSQWLGLWTFRAMLLLSLATFLKLSFDYGATVDELLAHIYGERIFNYYASGFADQSAKDFYNLHFYGGFFELICVVCVKISSWLGMNRYLENLYEVRHLVNAVFGWLMVAFAGLLARRLYGVWAGILAMFLLLVTPRFLGHAFNNPKDTPFAAIFLGALYFMSFFQRAYPFMKPHILAGLTICVGLSMAVRIGGLLLVCYAALFLAVLMFLDRAALDWKKLLRTFCVFVLSIMAAFILNALFSPWQLENPIVRPFQALREMSHLVGYPDSVIFEDHVWDYLHLTRRFLPIWLLISTPIVLMSGFVLSIFFCWRGHRRLFTGLLFFSVVFPVAYVLLKHPPLYHDMRHFFFIIGPAVVLASGGFCLAFRTLRNRAATSEGRQIVALIFGVGLVALSWHPASFILRNHPNEAVYFNQVVGGYPGAFFSFELDYWMNAGKEARRWIRTMGAINGRTEEDYELVNLNVAREGRTKILKDKSVVHGIFVDGYPVMLIRPKSGK